MNARNDARIDARIMALYTDTIGGQDSWNCSVGVNSLYICYELKNMLFLVSCCN